MTHIIDRRLNPKGKSVGNRQKFLRRAKDQIREAVKKSIQDKSITDIGGTGEKISIPAKGIKEPKFRQSSGKGQRDYVLPGNQEYLTGDVVPKPDGGAGGRGRKAGNSGEGEDDFAVTLSRDEFLDIFFEDLELPDLVKRNLKEVVSLQYQRAGFTPQGNPSTLNVLQTMRQAMGRRIALGRPKGDEVKALQAELFALEEKADKTAEDRERMCTLHAELDALVQRQKRIPFIDPVDVRFNRFEQVPKPTTQAVMFCLMDVSGSMGEREKDLSKRFFMLLYLFLTRQYEKIDVVFIRHTHEADEVDEQTFFYGRQTGGTVVSTSLEKMRQIIADRYPASEWNIYAAQAGDGDNWSGDSAVCQDLLVNRLMPLIQYYAYVEITSASDWMFGSFADGDLWKHYEQVASACPQFAMKKISERTDIFPVFRELFAKTA